MIVKKRTSPILTNDDGDEVFIPKGVSWGAWRESDSSLRQIVGWETFPQGRILSSPNMFIIAGH